MEIELDSFREISIKFNLRKLKELPLDRKKYFVLVAKMDLNLSLPIIEELTGINRGTCSKWLNSFFESNSFDKRKNNSGKIIDISE